MPDFRLSFLFTNSGPSILKDRFHMLMVLGLFAFLTMAKPGKDDRQHLDLVISLLFAALLFAIFPVVASLGGRECAIPSEDYTDINVPVDVSPRVPAGLFAAKGRMKLDVEISDAHSHGSIKSSKAGLSPAQQQIRNLISALRRSGLFGAVAGAIEGLHLVMLPQRTTIFVPLDSAFQSIRENERTELFEYHVGVKRFAYTQLYALNVGDTITTLLPDNSILVTSTQIMNFTLDDVRIISPDLYLDNTIAVHGIEKVLNYTVYGKGKRNPTISMPSPPQGASSPPPQASDITSRNPVSSSSPLSAPGLTATSTLPDASGVSANAKDYRSPPPLPVCSDFVMIWFLAAPLFYGFSFLSY